MALRCHMRTMCDMIGPRGVHVKYVGALLAFMQAYRSGTC